MKVFVCLHQIATFSCYDAESVHVVSNLDALGCETLFSDQGIEQIFFRGFQIATLFEDEPEIIQSISNAIRAMDFLANRQNFPIESFRLLEVTTRQSHVAIIEETRCHFWTFRYVLC